MRIAIQGRASDSQNSVAAAGSRIEAPLARNPEGLAARQDAIACFLDWVRLFSS